MGRMQRCGAGPTLCGWGPLAQASLLCCPWALQPGRGACGTRPGCTCLRGCCRTAALRRTWRQWCSTAPAAITGSGWRPYFLFRCRKTMQQFLRVSGAARCHAGMLFMHGSRKQLLARVCVTCRSAVLPRCAGDRKCGTHAWCLAQYESYRMHET